MAKKSPTVLSTEFLYEQGYNLVVKGEYWNPFARKRVDFAGFIDLIAFKEGETLGIQTTSRCNISARVKKISEHENVGFIRDSNWKIVVHGWDYKDGKPRIKVVDVS